MHNIDFKSSPRRKETFDEFDSRENQPRDSRRYSMAWVAVGTAVAGMATSMYGANKSAKAQQAATNANKASVDSTNAMNYQRWLESQGVGSNGQPINTWLPRYAMVQRPMKGSTGTTVSGVKTPTTFFASPISSTGIGGGVPSISSFGGGGGGNSRSWQSLGLQF